MSGAHYFTWPITKCQDRDPVVLGASILKRQEIEDQLQWTTSRNWPMSNRLVTQSMTSHDLVKRAPRRLYRTRDGIGQTPCSYERYLVSNKRGGAGGGGQKGHTVTNGSQQRGQDSGAASVLHRRHQRRMTDSQTDRQIHRHTQWRTEDGVRG